MLHTESETPAKPKIGQTMRALWGMARPLIMVSVYLVFILGLLAARAHGSMIDLRTLGAGLIALTLVMLSVHYANEYADYETDRLSTRTPYSGGSGVLPRGLISRPAALLAARAAGAAGLAVGAVFAFLGWMPMTAFGLLSLGFLGGWFYSMPPLRLAYRGWGELDNAVLGGLLLPLFGYTLAGGSLTWSIMLAFIPFVLLTFNNLLATTWSDRDADALTDKRTLATRQPKHRLRVLYAVVGFASYGLIWVLNETAVPSTVALSMSVALPLSLWGMLAYTAIHSPHPSVWAMVAALIGQMIGWWAAAPSI